MHRGGIRHGHGGGHRGGGRGRGGGRRGGRGGHPSGLTGKEIGLWYAAKSKEKRKQQEVNERAVVTMSHQREEKINRLLGDLRGENSDSEQYSGRRDRSRGYPSQYHDAHGHIGKMNRHSHHRPHHRDFSNAPQTSSWWDESDHYQGSQSSRFSSDRSKVKCEDDDEMQYYNDFSIDTSNNEPSGSATAKTETKSFLDEGDQRGDFDEGASMYSQDSTDVSFDNDMLADGMEVDLLCGFDEIAISTIQPDAANQKQDLAEQAIPTAVLQRDPVLDEMLLNELETKSSSMKYQDMLNFREKLPSFKMKQDILQLVANNQVVVISGETGCGKTTQVAQFILDEAITNSSGSLCRVACTQPRRISAISVAERVANERDEPCGGASVGYQIRLESKLPRQRGSIIYCTTGVLLRWLVSDPLLRCTSHIIIDEIHERDLMSDFLLIIVKDLLPRRPDLKLILMSATLNAEMFSSFFGNCPMAHIPGFTYPVKEFHIEEVIELTRYQVNPSSPYRPRFGQGRGRGRGRGRGGPTWKNFARRKSPAKDKRAAKMAWGNEGEDEMEDEIDEEVQWREYIQSIQSRFRRTTIETLEEMDLDQIDFDLAIKLIQHICLNMEEGAILVFMPGWEDISKLHEGLKKTLQSGKVLLIPLHSMMPTANQREVFDRPPKGVRKIVIATNIAETSITIDDIVYVVDCGKVKEKSYDASRKISCLLPVWISTASSRQRRGRAGRVQPGCCFHLYTELQARSFIDYQLPEMLRTPLEELCLQIKLLRLGMIREFLSKALQPPDSQAVQNALDDLIQLNALDSRENLTPLGHHLALLPVDPRIGKMILFGAILSCLDPVLTIASSMGFKEPFVFPIDKKQQGDRVRARLAGYSFSDHIAVLNAYQGWETAKRHGNASSYCWENFLSAQSLKMLSSMKVQFAHLLRDSGFLNSADPKHEEANFNSDNTKLIKAVLCAGLYPNVVKIEHDPKLKRPPRMRTQVDGKVALHPKSVNVNVVAFPNDWLIYHQKIKSSKVFIHDCTMIAPFPLLFFGGNISVLLEEGQEIIAVDHFIKFKSPRRIANLVKELRAELDKLLERKIAQPGIHLSAVPGSDSCGSSLLCAIIELITSEENMNWKRRRAMEQGDSR